MVRYLASSNRVSSLSPRGGISPGPAPPIPRAHCRIPQHLFLRSHHGTPSALLPSLPCFQQPPSHIALSLALPLAPRPLLSPQPPPTVSPPPNPRLHNPYFPRIPFQSCVQAPSTAPRGPSGSLSTAAPAPPLTPHRPSAAGALQATSPRLQLQLTSAVQVGLPGPTSESASDPPSESRALRASRECSSSGCGGGVWGGELEWRRGRWRLRAGITPAQVSASSLAAAHIRTGTASEGGAMRAGGGALGWGRGLTRKGRRTQDGWEGSAAKGNAARKLEDACVRHKAKVEEGPRKRGRGLWD